MRRRRRTEELERHEAWAIPYGDLVTLLLAFFVVMYSISSVNEGKYRVVSDSLTKAFHGTPHAQQPINIGQAPMQPIEEQLPVAEVNRMIAAGLPAPRLMSASGPNPPWLLLAHGERPALDRGPGASSSAASSRQPSAATSAATAPPSVLPGTLPPDPAAERELGQVAQSVGQAMRALISSGRVRVHQHGTWVGVDISSDVLFGSGVARLSPAAVSILERLADALKDWPNAIRVEGHTDDRPIDTAAFPSNWELSAARAASVVHLFMDRGVAPARMAVLGFGPYRPAAANSTAAGRAANRRVELVILSRDSAPEEGL